MKILNEPVKLLNGNYLATVDYETEEPGYGKSVKDTIVTVDQLYKCYIETRNNKCYCGHTDTCDCADLSLDMFKEHLENGNIYFDNNNGWKSVE